MKLTYYGHACFAIEFNGICLLFDPFITPNPLANHININNIKADYIFITHGHEDHLADALSIAKNNDATIISNFEIITWYNNKHQYTKTHSMNLGGKWKFPFGEVKCVVAQHSSALPDGTYAGNPVGFVINSPNGNFYYSGDTALTADMKLIPLFLSLNFAILPIGDNYTMGIEEAIIAAKFIETNTVIGVHFDTFPPIKINKNAAIKAFEKEGINLILLSIGASTQMA